MLLFSSTANLTAGAPLHALLIPLMLHPSVSAQRLVSICAVRREQTVAVNLRGAK
ncbi:MAG: hypothetical protein ABI702_16830 [Burkholderiales bacterium]